MTGFVLGDGLFLVDIMVRHCTGKVDNGMHPAGESSNSFDGKANTLRILASGRRGAMVE